MLCQNLRGSSKNTLAGGWCVCAQVSLGSFSLPRYFPASRLALAGQS